MLPAQTAIATPHYVALALELLVEGAPSLQMVLLAVSPADSDCQFRFLLNALYDRAFDRGLITLDDLCRIALSSRVPHTATR